MDGRCLDARRQLLLRLLGPAKQSGRLQVMVGDDMMLRRDIFLSCTVRSNSCSALSSVPQYLFPQSSMVGTGFDGFIPIPDRPLNFVPAKAGEVIHLGQITCRILEDGSRTGRNSHPCIPTYRQSTHHDNRQPPRYLRTHPPPQNPRPPTPLARNARRDLPHNPRHHPLPRPRPLKPRNRQGSHRRARRGLHDRAHQVATHVLQPYGPGIATVLYDYAEFLY